MYKIEELFDKCTVLVKAIDRVDEEDRGTMVVMAVEYLEQLGEAIGVVAKKQ